MVNGTAGAASDEESVVGCWLWRMERSSCKYENFKADNEAGAGPWHFPQVGSLLCCCVAVLCCCVAVLWSGEILLIVVIVVTVLV